MIEKLDAVFHVVEVADVPQQSADGRACSALTRVTMDDQDVFWVFLKESITFLRDLEKIIERRRLMIWPQQIDDTTTKELLSIVDGSFWRIYDKVLRSVLLL